MRGIKAMFATTICFVGTCAATAADAADYYVSPTGTAAWSQCTNIATPCSIDVAMANAVAGDKIYFRGGTYAVTDGARSEHGTYEPAHSGTAGNPIVFVAYPGERPVIEMNCTYTGDATLTPPAICNRCYALGINHQSHITWDGFALTTSNNTTAGINIHGVSSTQRSAGVTIQNIAITSGAQTNNDRDNCDIIWAAETTQLAIRGVRVHGFGVVAHSPSGGSDNVAALKMYHNDHATIENNEFYNMQGSSYCISVKSDLDDSTIRNNYLHDCTTGIGINGFLSGAQFSSTNDRIYNNVIANTAAADYLTGIQVDGEESSDQAGFQVFNNTLHIPSVLVSSGTGHGAGFYAAHMSDLSFHDNIVVIPNDGNTGHFGHFNIDSVSTVLEEDHNCYYGNQLGINWHFYGGTYYTQLSNWQSSGVLIGGGDPGSYGGQLNTDIWSDPGFANASGNFSQLGDLLLAVDSPCRGAGRGGVDMGARLCAVGPNPTCAGFGDTLAPAAPTNLTVQ